MVIKRVLWELAHGPVPHGHVLQRQCRVRGCIRPDCQCPVHRPATFVPKHRRRQRTATRNARILALYHESGWTMRRIARLFEVSSSRVRQILIQQGDYRITHPTPRGRDDP